MYILIDNIEFPIILPAERNVANAMMKERGLLMTTIYEGDPRLGTHLTAMGVRRPFGNYMHVGVDGRLPTLWGEDRRA